MKHHAERLLKDFILGDRRLIETSDIEVDMRWSHQKGDLEWPYPFASIVLTWPHDPLQFTFSDGKHFCVLNFTAHNRLNGNLREQLAFLSSMVAYFTTSKGITRQLGQYFKSIRESSGTSGSTVATSVGVPERTLELWESGASSPSGSQMYSWLQALDLVCPPHTALVRVVDFSPQLLRFLQEDPIRLQELTPDQFERFVAERLDRMGYNVTLAGDTNRRDGGIDLIAVPRAANLGSVVLAGQMKHHRGDQRTGRESVDRLLAWKDSVFGVGLLVTNTGFTRDAIWTAQKEQNKHFLRLRDFTDLKRWLEGRFGEEQDWREIPDRIELAPGIIVEIPRPRIVSAIDFDLKSSTIPKTDKRR